MASSPTLSIPKIILPELCPPVFVLDSSTEIQRSFELSHYKGIRLVCHHAEYQMYARPPSTSIHAYRVWKEAGLPAQTMLGVIEIQLLDWALQHATLDIHEDVIRSVTCFFEKGKVHFLSWNIFLRWMTNACRQSY